MIQQLNKDSSFFIIDSPDIAGAPAFKDKKVNRYLQDKIISFQVTEEMGKCTTGSLKIYDPRHVYSRVFRNGVRFDITWGFKKYNAKLLEQGVNSSNANEITGLSERRGLKCVVHVPSGTGPQDGNIVYNITFYSMEIFSDQIIKLWDSGTYADVVREIFTSFEISSENQIIDFSLGNTALSRNTALRQEEPNYKFLMRRAYEWRSAFQIGYNQKGKRIGVFLDPDKIANSEYTKKLTGAKGFYRTLEYRDGLANTIDYSWAQHVGEQGVGDSVRLTVVNGQTVVQRFQAETETVTTWVFVPEKIRQELNEKDNFIDKTALVKQWLKVNDFQTLVNQGFFKKVVQTTAPQGFGYTINVKMIGDPLLTSMTRINFGAGFPDRLQQANAKEKKDIDRFLTSFYIKKITHTIDKNGYLCNSEIADAYTVNGGFIL